MHLSSMKIMERFIKRYLNRPGKLDILDVGSKVVKGQSMSYRTLFTRPDWTYTGADIEPGDNVDVVLRSPDRWQFADDRFNVVISGQTIEHVEWPWEFMREVARILKPRGLACIVAPAQWHLHRHPIDTFRYFPDGMTALARWAGLRAVRTGQDKANGKREQSTYLVAQK